MIKKLLITTSLITYSVYATDAIKPSADDVKNITNMVDKKVKSDAQLEAKTISTVTKSTQNATKEAKKTPKYIVNPLAPKPYEDAYKFVVKDGAINDAMHSLANKSLDRRRAIKDKDYEKAYDYLPPAQKKVIEKESYSSYFGGAIIYTGAKVTKIICDADSLDESESCQVKVYISYKKKQKDNYTLGTLLTEKWIKEDGKWWFYQK